MKTSIPIPTLFVSALALCLSCGAAAAQAPSASAAALLAVKGDELVNGKGEVVRLRGFGLGGMLHRTRAKPLSHTRQSR